MAEILWVETSMYKFTEKVLKDTHQGDSSSPWGRVEGDIAGWQ